MLLNGVPGAGKTSLSMPLAWELGAPVIGKDAVKESLFGVAGVSLPTGPLGALASDTMWRLARLIEGLVVVDSFWATGRDEDFLHAGLQVSGAARAVEVWCAVPLEVARSRYLSRPRHPSHDDEDRVATWQSIVASAREPCSSQPVIVVPTVGAVDVLGLARELRELLHSDASLVRR